MPELPEVETIKRDLEREIVGKRIKTVEVSGTRSIRRGTKKQFIGRLEGAKVTGVQRKGKYLLLKLDPGGEAHPRHADVAAGGSAAVRRPSHLRGDVRERSRAPRRGRP